MHHTFSRLELYHLVWAEPKTVLAKRLGISDVGLAKTCVKAHIPMPERGYWTKRKTGKKTIQLSLPPRGLGKPDWIEIGKPRHLYYSQDLEIDTIPAPPVFEEPVESIIDRASALLGRAKIVATFHNVHRDIAVVLEEDLRKRENLLKHGYSRERPRFEAREEQRRLRVVNGLFHALGRAGARPWLRVTESDVETGAIVGNQNVSFTVGLTASRNRSRSRARTKGRTAFAGLKISIDADRGPNEISSGWEDSDTSRIEACLREVTVAILVAGELSYRRTMIRQYERRVEARRRMEEGERKEREEAKQRARQRTLDHEQKLRDTLTAQAGAWRQARLIREYVVSVQSFADGRATGALGDRVAVWASWALQEADRLDPLGHPLETILEKYPAYSQVDDDDSPSPLRD